MQEGMLYKNKVSKIAWRIYFKFVKSNIIANFMKYDWNPVIFTWYKINENMQYIRRFSYLYVEYPAIVLTKYDKCQSNVSYYCVLLFIDYVYSYARQTLKKNTLILVFPNQIWNWSILHFMKLVKFIRKEEGI